MVAVNIGTKPLLIECFEEIERMAHLIASFEVPLFVALSSSPLYIIRRYRSMRVTVFNRHRCHKQRSYLFLERIRIK